MRYLVSLLACVAFSAGAVHAQWQLGVDLGVAYFGAIARDTVTEGQQATLGTALSPGLRIEREMGRVRLGVGVSTASMGLALENDTLWFGFKRAYRLFELAPEFAVRLTTSATGVVFWLEAGPLLDIWLPDGGDERARGGAFGGASLAVPLGGRLTGAFTFRASAMASPFDESDLVDDFVLSTTSRIAAQVGLRYRL